MKEDVDELSFEVGDTIRVIEYDDPEDQVMDWRPDEDVFLELSLNNQLLSLSLFIFHRFNHENNNKQEEGWLMGCKEGTVEKGLFPANFTRPL